MALKSCRECKKKVSTEAKICPRCGVPDPTTIKRKTKSKKTLKGTGAGGWPKEYLEAQAELHGSSYENEVNKYVEPSDWDEFTKNKVNKYVEPSDWDESTKNKVKYTPEPKGFWTGSEGLAKTFWLYFIGGNIVGNIFLKIAAGEEEVVTIFLLIVIVCWTIAATVGIFNAADIYKEEKISSGQTYGYATAAKVVSIILILSGLGQALN